MSPSWNLKLGTWEEPCSIKEWNKMEVLMRIPRKKPCLQKQNKTKWLIRTAAIYICRGLNDTDQRIIIFPFSLALTLWIAIPCISLSEKKWSMFLGHGNSKQTPEHGSRTNCLLFPLRWKLWSFLFGCLSIFATTDIQKKTPLSPTCDARKEKIHDSIWR